MDGLPTAQGGVIYIFCDFRKCTHCCWLAIFFMSSIPKNRQLICITKPKLLVYDPTKPLSNLNLILSWLVRWAETCPPRESLCAVTKTGRDINGLPSSFWPVKNLLHRKRIQTEEKAKVVAAVWGEEFIQFLACQLFCTG